MNTSGLNQLEGVAIGRLSLEEIGRLFDGNFLVFVAERVHNPKNNAIPLIQQGVELDIGKLAIFRNHGIQSLVVVLVEKSLKDEKNLNSLKAEAIRKWKDNEDVRVEAKKKAEVLQATAIAIYRAAIEFCAQFSDVEFTNPAEIEDKAMIEKIVALGTAIEDFGPAVMEAFYDLENGHGSILSEIDELSKPTEDEARQATQFAFDVLRIMNSFNKLYKRESIAFVYDVSLKFEHTEVVRMFLAAFFMPSAFWGGWQGENHEMRSAVIFATIRKYKDTLPEGVETLILNHSRIDWINHYAYERGEEDPSVIERVDVSLVRSALVLAVTEEFSGKVSKGTAKRTVAEEIASRYSDGPTLYEPHRHVNLGLPLYSYVLTALFNAHSVFPAGTILEFDRRDLVSSDKTPRPPSITRLAEKLCAISMGGNSVPELYPLVWIMWERRRGSFSQLLAPESGIVSMSSSFYHGRQFKQMCWAVGLRNIVKPHPHYRVEVPRAIGLMDKKSYKNMLGGTLVMLPNYIQHFVDIYMKGKKQH